eukprot:gnl/TRDRNA2_/TRDRNA2_198064_c0_seq1.p1 gnl/TRDRNA2_/TRDRNA2_198064_c0~~gnl/TRDRNA2_/TRDRNA2_198064_c0_seq1.p1  ORF type:complete len:606 (-),score=80.26 gnl/TRDRNA2_/TRDRNA2_198064_c0_seq1:100-1875(-)
MCPAHEQRSPAVCERTSPVVVGESQVPWQNLVAGARWEEDTNSCGVCGQSIGRRHMRRRHHCRLCGRCVCSGCSPDVMPLPSHRSPQRVCVPCGRAGAAVQHFEEPPDFPGLAAVEESPPPASLPNAHGGGVSFRSSGVSDGNQSPRCVVCDSKFGNGRHKQKEHACGICSRAVCSVCCPSLIQLDGESALLRACEPCVNMVITGTQAMKDRLAAVGQRLHLIGGAAIDIDGPPPEVGTLRQAAEYCESALPALKDVRNRLVAVRAGHVRSDDDGLYFTDGPSRKGSEDSYWSRDSGARSTSSLSMNIPCDGSRASLPPSDDGSDSQNGDRAITPRDRTTTPRDMLSARETQDAASIPSRSAVGEGDSRWAEDGPTCAVCDAVFGKRHLRRRHHCRLCGKCVCSACSPSSLKFDGMAALQRACTPCVGNAREEHLLKDRLAFLADRLRTLVGSAGAYQSKSPQASCPVTRAASLEEALSICVDAVVPLEEMQRELNALYLKAAARKRARPRMFSGMLGRLRRSSSPLSSSGDLLGGAGDDRVLFLPNSTLSYLQQKRSRGNSEEEWETDCHARPARANTCTPCCASSCGIL